MIPGLPSYLQQNTAASAQNYMRQLPGLFNTSGLTSAYNNQISTNFDQGRALAAAAANQYTQRAQQEGGSTLGAGFAQAGAMLPVYAQNASLQSDLANKQLQYRGQQATLGAGLAGDIGRLQSAQQGTWSDYLLNQQRLQQQQQQFYGTMGLQQQQLNQTAKQQAAQNGLQGAALALQYAPRGTGSSYYTNNNGSGMSYADQQTINRVNSQQSYLQGILGGLTGSRPNGFIGGGPAGAPTGYAPVSTKAGNASDSEWGNAWGVGF